MQVFFSKKVNFLCICSNTQKVLFAKTKAHDPYRQMHSESHAFSVSSIYNTIYYLSAFNCLPKAPIVRILASLSKTSSD